MRRAAWVLALALLASGCEGGSAPVDAGAGSDAGPGDASVRPDASVPGPDYLERLETRAQFDSLAAERAEVKYLARVDGREPLVAGAECLFQNTARFPFHVQFLRAVFPELSDLAFETYVSFVLRRASRRMWGGVLRRFERVTHPFTGRAGIVTFGVYTEGGGDESLSVDELVQVFERLRACAPFAEGTLVLVPDGAAQEASVRAQLAELNGRGVPVRFPSELVERDYEVYSEGESYGFLRVVPRGEIDPGDVGLRDVLVIEAAPADLSTVAGLLTELPQSVHSHTNLRLREKELPNAMVVGVHEDPRVVALSGRLVHVISSATGLLLEAATLEDAERFWEARRPMVGPVRSDLSVTALAGLETLGHEDAIAYGAKAANLGELRSILPPENRVEGFAIPFSEYRAFVVHNAIDAQIADLLVDPRVRTDRAHRASRLDDVRDAIRDGAFPPGSFERLSARIREVFGASADTTYLRFRSSTNVEDLDELSGAGLYDSKTGCLADDLDGDELGPSRCLTPAHQAYLEAELARRRAEQLAHPERTWLAAIIADLEGDLSEEKPVADALRKVWRSLWNDRAFDERDYYGIDHASVYMGVAVAPSFVMERQEAVAVTHLRPDAGDPLYRVVTQLGEIGVVRPADPSAVPETLTFRRRGDVAAELRVVVPSSMSPGGARLWSDAEVETLTSLLFLVHDHFATAVYPHLSDLRLDLEIEVTSDERIVIKQARPYLGVEP